MGLIKKYIEKGRTKVKRERARRGSISKRIKKASKRIAIRERNRSKLPANVRIQTLINDSGFPTRSTL